MKKKIFIKTLGCKVNQYESASFLTGFTEAGYCQVNDKAGADIVVINTCAVTAKAGAQSRQAIRRAARNNPDARIIITGCFAEIGADELKNDEVLQNRDIVFIGNSSKDTLVINSTERTSIPFLPGSIREAEKICSLPVKRFADQARAWLRIQDGCESFCTYCIVPYTRGRSRSLSREEVINQAKVFEQQGHREIVLTGIHLGYYGRDLESGIDLVSILEELSRVTPNVSYRISSLEPLEISDKLLSLMKERSNIQPHLHIPLQSGHDEILKRMNRRYSTAQFREVLERIRNQLPEAALGIDMLAGFPGETDEQFEDGIAFLNGLPLTYLHVFPYSIRPGTVAAGFPNQIDGRTKEKRVARLQELGRQKKIAFYSSQLGRNLPVLVEGRRDRNGFLKGFTGNYVSVIFNGPDKFYHSRTSVRLISLEGDHVLARREKQ
ncbi:tRNA (N(6)-L-threonylcarbamoyladenosine(37)-C(2))-methylthiotransferase MtaB [Desulfomarina sp.]